MGPMLKSGALKNARKRDGRAPTSREVETDELDGDDDTDAVLEPTPPPVRRRGVPVWGALLATALIVGSSAIIAYTAYQVWTM
jgi:hypothetical protein